MPRCAMAERCIERPVAPFQAPGAAAEKSRFLLTPKTTRLLLYPIQTLHCKATQQSTSRRGDRLKPDQYQLILSFGSGRSCAESEYRAGSVIAESATRKSASFGRIGLNFNQQWRSLTA
jgi:hypothetical protein